MNALKILAISLFSVAVLSAQPPPCLPNQNNGAGGIIGQSNYIGSFDGTIINFSFSLPTLILDVEFNDVFVLYIVNGSQGRTLIDSSVDDAADPYRIAITNSNVNGFGSTVSFPSGFEITHAIAIDPNGANLYAIPPDGNVSNGGLNFIASVNSTLTSNTQTHFDLSFEPSQIGLTDDSFFVFGVYIGHNGYTYDEGYGEGIAPGTAGADAITFTAPQAGGPCFGSLSINEYQNSIEAYYLNDHLIVNGLNEHVKISTYDILGRETSVKNHLINGQKSIPMFLKKNLFQFIVIETANKKKVLKVIPN